MQRISFAENRSQRRLSLVTRPFVFRRSMMRIKRGVCLAWIVVLGSAPRALLGGGVVLGVLGGTGGGGGRGLGPMLQELVAGVGSAFPWGSVAATENV
jgi:hypothetical protein